MTMFSKLATMAVATFIVTTTLVQAGALIDFKPKKDHTPMPIHDNTPVNVDRFIDYDAAPNLLETKPGLQARQFGVQAALGCEVAGTPSEFPDDLFLINRGTETLVAGTNIKWQVKGTGLKGYLALNVDLEAGGGIIADGVLRGGVEAGLPCLARAI